MYVLIIAILVVLTAVILSLPGADKCIEDITPVRKTVERSPDELEFMRDYENIASYDGTKQYDFDK